VRRGTHREKRGVPQAPTPRYTWSEPAPGVKGATGPPKSKDEQGRAMGRGFLSGLFWGVVFSGLGLAAASKLLPVVEVALPGPDAADVEVPGESAFARDGAETAPVIPATDPAPEVEAAVAPAAEGATPDAPPQSDTAPAAQPETGAPEAEALPAPETGSAAAPPAPTEDPVLPSPEASAPDTPEADAAPEAGAADSPETPVAADLGTAPAVPEVGLDPAAPEAPEAPEDTGVSLFDGVGEIAVPAPDTDDPAGGLRPAPAGPALEVNGLEFEWDGRAPLLSVILFARGGGAPDPGTLAAFPVPLTIAVDPLAPGAADLAEAARGAGAEVTLIAALPEGAAPADVEVAFQSYLDAVPTAATVIDTEEGRFQESRPRAVQVAAVLAATGHGMVTYEQGLDTALQVATQQGVPAATVLRAFDDGTRSVGAMKRFLDQAAFRAGLDGAAIVTGELRPEALQALAEWVLGTRAATVAMAPVSAVLNSAP
jgi:hypothetical protein